MYTRRLLIGAVSLVAALAASSAVAPGHFISLRGHMTPGVAHLRAFGGRSLAQTQSVSGRKLDGALADLSRHLGGVRAASALSDLRGLSPAARFSVDPMDAVSRVLIDAVTRGDPQKLKTALEGLGLTHSALYSNDVSGWLPVAQIDAATQLAEVHAIRAAMPRTRAGAVTSQGDYVLHSDLVRTGNALDGTGVTVGVLSDSFDCYSVYAASGVPAAGQQGYAQNTFTATAAQDKTSGDLASSVNVLADANCLNYNPPPPKPQPQLPLGDEGRAMLQVIHDIAPGASLAFTTAEGGEAAFAAGITKLAAPVSAGGAGAKIIADDVGYFSEPFYQDGLVAQAIDAAKVQGVTYFSAAGNEGNASYENTAPTFGGPVTSLDSLTEQLLNFDIVGGTVSPDLPITINQLDPGQFAAIVVQWDQPFITGAPTSLGAQNQIDVCVKVMTQGGDSITDVNNSPITCTGPNTVGHDPVQILIVGNPADTKTGVTGVETLNLEIGVVSGSLPGRIKVSVETNGQVAPITKYQTNSGTVQGHPGAAGAAAVGAAFYYDTPACGATVATLEQYSSSGGTPILFSATGSRLSTPTMRQKPDFVGPDGGNDTFLGIQLANIPSLMIPSGLIPGASPPCQNVPAYPNFFGTSAATPHVAGIAALMLQANPAVTPAQIVSALQGGALSMGGSKPNPSAGVYNFNTGYGFIQADAALASVEIKPLAPTISVTPTSITVGGTATLTWSEFNTTGCTASGTWSGAQKSSGSMTIAPTTAAAYPYSLVCSNSAGNSPSAGVTLTVNAAASGGGGHGGGALGEGLLLGLAGLGAARLRRVLRRGKAG